MNTQQLQRDWFNDIVQQNAALASAVDLPWLTQTREQAMHAISRIALPERKQETWRYSDFGKLYQHAYHYQHSAHETPAGSTVEDWIYDDSASHRLVFVNGHFAPDISDIHALPDQVIIGSLRTLLSSEPEKVSAWLALFDGDTTDVFNELNRAFINDGLVIHVPENAVVDKPIEVVYLNVADQQNLLCQPRSLVILEANSHARLVERYIGRGTSSYFLNGVTGISLAANARLQHDRLQHEIRTAHHLSRIMLRQAAASEYRGINIATGAAWSRTDINSCFDGPHALCELDGLYTVGEQQYNDFHIDIRHNLPHCRSRENFKGIVYGNGRAVFDGRILVEKDAQKTDAQLTNRNLLLSQNGEVDTKPQLEIHADDVKCSHGTTVGKLDPAQLFYLRSRGIDARQARKMICLGFAEQVLAQFEDDAVHDFVHERIARLMDQQVALL